MIERLGSPSETSPEQRRGTGRHTWDGSLLWADVRHEILVDFLRGYSTHESAVKVNCAVLADFIEQKARIGELTSWTVALMSGEAGTGQVSVAGHRVNQIFRAPNERSTSLADQKAQGRFIIRRILAPRDEAIDLGPEQYEAALAMAIDEYRLGLASSRRKDEPAEPSGIHLRHVRGKGDPARGIAGHPETGLMLLYPLSPTPGELDFDGPLMGFGLSFPASDTTTTVAYTVNNTYWNQEYGGEQ